MFIEFSLCDIDHHIFKLIDEQYLSFYPIWTYGWSERVFLINRVYGLTDAIELCGFRESVDSYGNSTCDL